MHRSRLLTKHRIRTFGHEGCAEPQTDYRTYAILKYKHFLHKKKFRKTRSENNIFKHLVCFLKH
jgi:hypothetical protein